MSRLCRELHNARHALVLLHGQDFSICFIAKLERLAKWSSHLGLGSLDSEVSSCVGVRDLQTRWVDPAGIHGAHLPGSMVDETLDTDSMMSLPATLNTCVPDEPKLCDHALTQLDAAVSVLNHWHAAACLALSDVVLYSAHHPLRLFVLEFA